MAVGPLTVPGMETGRNHFVNSSAAALEKGGMRPQMKWTTIYFLIWELYIKNINTIMKKVLT